MPELNTAASLSYLPGALEPCTEEEEVEGAGSLDRGTTVEASDEVPP